MLSVNKNGDNHIELHLSGKIDSETMKTGLDDLLKLSEDIQNGTMLYTIESFDLPSLSAITVKLKKLPELFKLISTFNKAAVLTDKHWLRVISELESLLVPGLEIKAFTLDEKEKAEAWLAE